jgi:16S rRNA (guanine(966)-N(2))-methyltransferase RsmD
LGGFFLKNLSMAHKYIRIIGGQYRRTPITVVNIPAVRPTPDRVRETLFNWLSYLWGQTFDDKVVLDMFAGSGALGFEAASRGVAQVHMIERNQTALTALYALRDKLGATQVHIYAGDAPTVLDRLNQTPYDLILLDPPFNQNWLPSLWPRLPNKLRAEGLIYLESAAKVNPPEPFTTVRQAHAGQVHYQLLQVAKTP